MQRAVILNKRPYCYFLAEQWIRNAWSVRPVFFWEPAKLLLREQSGQWYDDDEDDMVVVMTMMTLSLDTSVAVNNIFRKEFMLPSFLRMLQSSKPYTRSTEIKNTTTVLWCQVIRNHIILCYKDRYKRIYQRTDWVYKGLN